MSIMLSRSASARLSDAYAGWLSQRAWWVVLAAVLLTGLALAGLDRLSVSTRLEALMPEQAPSVVALNNILDKTSSFASIHVVARAEEPALVLDYIRAVQARIDALPWVSSSQYFEDIDVLERHKLLLADTRELLDLERDLDTHIGAEIARSIATTSDVPVTIELREDNISGDSMAPSDGNLANGSLDEVINGIEAHPETRRLFASEDQQTVALVVWPRPGLTGLADAKRMVTDTQAVLGDIQADAYGHNLRAGVAGRIRNKVAQFDAVIGDAKASLGGAMALIMLLLLFSYRRIAAVPCIVLPLLTGLVWTLGATAVTVGTLNLITIFLVLILFGLGIDFGIHNFSRYLEVRRQGGDLHTALATVIGHTGPASLIAMVTSVLGFLSLMFTDFRAFAEFGLIAGMGLAMIFVCMYTLFPALLVIADRWMRYPPRPAITSSASSKDIAVRRTFTVSALVLVAAGYLALDLRFEQNFKNLEATRSGEHQWATAESKRVFPEGHDRAILALPGWRELTAVNDFFQRRMATDVNTPTIDKVSSILDYLPSPAVQRQRLEVIGRLRQRVDEFDAFDPDNAARARRYVDIDGLQLAQLPAAVRRAYTSADGSGDYLLYVYNSVSMDDARLARAFYQDAASVRVEGKRYAAAAEGFVFVEMIAMMKADAVKAVGLVVLVTALVLLLFFRSLRSLTVVLLPPLAGVVLTLAVMVLTGQRLSIINMVVLPALVGIAVDNAIHIYHRFQTTQMNAAQTTMQIRMIMHTTGRAALLTTLTTLVSFGGLTTASMGGLRGMGYLAITGFVCCMLCTWLLTPALLKWRAAHMNCHAWREGYVN